MAPAQEAEFNDPFRTGKAYTSAEAARLAGTTAAVRASCFAACKRGSTAGR
jgi:hypothetical protein